MLLDDFWVLFCTRVLILGLMALSFDLVWGYAGILSFGQALFFGMAGYCTALLATKLEITSILVLLPAAALVGLIVAFLVAAIVILGKRPPSVVFVALGTLTGSYVVERLARGWSYVGGQNGIPSLPRFTAAGHEISEGPVFYYIALVCCSWSPMPVCACWCAPSSAWCSRASASRRAALHSSATRRRTTRASSSRLPV